MIEESRSALHEQFVLTFADRKHANAAVTQVELAEMSRLLTTHLPTSYVQFMHRHGPVYCPGILHQMMEHGLDHPDLRQFLTPREVLKRSRDLWSERLPVDLFAFATDCMGNAFCFRQSKAPQEDAPVLFLSRQADQLLDLEESFDGLLQWYVRHIRPAGALAAT